MYCILNICHYVGKTLSKNDLFVTKDAYFLKMFFQIHGGLAAADGRIRKDDRILEINCQDLSYGTQEQAAQIIAVSSNHFNLSQLWNWFLERTTVGLQDLAKLQLWDLGWGYGDMRTWSPTVS